MTGAYGVLWKTWGVLLALTAVMVFVDVMDAPRSLLVAVLLAAMLAKATLIALHFMGLRHERLAVGVSIGFSILFFGVVLFGLIVPDGLAVLSGGR